MKRLRECGFKTQTASTLFLTKKTRLEVISCNNIKTFYYTTTQ